MLLRVYAVCSRYLTLDERLRTAIAWPCCGAIRNHIIATVTEFLLLFTLLLIVCVVSDRALMREARGEIAPRRGRKSVMGGRRRKMSNLAEEMNGQEKK